MKGIKVPVERLRPTFIEGSLGNLFCLWSSADTDKCLNDVDFSDDAFNPRIDNQRHIVLLLPPFGEEINLCRRFYSLIRARLTRLGLDTVQPDLFGTGDSAGSMEEVTWEVWQADIRAVIEHINIYGSPFKFRLSIVAARAGCLLAKEAIACLMEGYTALPLHNLVFVQPEFSGEDLVNRLFRARVMTQRLEGNKSQNTRDLWRLTEQGQAVQAGGHLLSAALCQSLKLQSLDDLLFASNGKHRTLFELQSDQKLEQSKRCLLSKWNVQVSPSTQFWKSYDIEPEKSLIEAVVAATVR